MVIWFLTIIIGGVASLHLLYWSAVSFFFLFILVNSEIRSALFVKDQISFYLSLIQRYPTVPCPCVREKKKGHHCIIITTLLLSAIMWSWCSLLQATGWNKPPFVDTVTKFWYILVSLFSFALNNNFFNIYLCSHLQVVKLSIQNSLPSEYTRMVLLQTSLDKIDPTQQVGCFVMRIIFHLFCIVNPSYLRMQTTKCEEHMLKFSQFLNIFIGPFVNMDFDLTICAIWRQYFPKNWES